MKLFIIIIFGFLLFLINSLSVIAHKENTHQYIVSEAYKLLKKQIGCDINPMKDYVGTTDGRITDWWNQLWNLNPFISEKMVAGAWDEDLHDIVYHYDINNRLIVTLTPFVGGYFSKVFFASSSHFWDPDIGNDLNSRRSYFYGFNVFEHCPNYPTISIGPFHNALDNALNLTHGRWPLAWKEDGLFGDFYQIDWEGFPYMYNNSSWHVLVRWYFYGPILLPQVDYYRDFESRRNFLVFNILGRLCHLLGDMSLPTHVHLDEHAQCTDEYEEFMGNGWDNSYVTDWDNTTVLSYKGGFINPTCPAQNKYWDPIEFLFYTTAQIADHFASHRRSGNDNYEEVGEIRDVIYDDVHSSHPGPTQMSNWEYNHSVDDKTAIRDATFPYVIRATAGLLYWFAIETGMLPSNGCFGVNVNLSSFDLYGKNYIFKYSNTLTAGDFIFESTVRNSHFVAGNEITMSDGFEARAGSEFHAYIGPCLQCTNDENNPYPYGQ